MRQQRLLGYCGAAARFGGMLSARNSGSAHVPVTSSVSPLEGARSRLLNCSVMSNNCCATFTRPLPVIVSPADLAFNWSVMTMPSTTFTRRSSDLQRRLAFAGRRPAFGRGSLRGVEQGPQIEPQPPGIAEGEASLAGQAAQHALHILAAARQIERDVGTALQRIAMQQAGQAPASVDVLELADQLVVWNRGSHVSGDLAAETAAFELQFGNVGLQLAIDQRDCRGAAARLHMRHRNLRGRQAHVRIDARQRGRGHFVIPAKAERPERRQLRGRASR